MTVNVPNREGLEDMEPSTKLMGVAALALVVLGFLCHFYPEAALSKEYLSFGLTYLLGFSTVIIAVLSIFMAALYKEILVDAIKIGKGKRKLSYKEKAIMSSFKVTLFIAMSSFVLTGMALVLVPFAYFLSPVEIGEVSWSGERFLALYIAFGSVAEIFAAINAVWPFVMADRDIQIEEARSDMDRSLYNTE